jgi:hypothetical protein
LRQYSCDKKKLRANLSLEKGVRKMLVKLTPVQKYPAKNEIFEKRLFYQI